MGKFKDFFALDDEQKDLDDAFEEDKETASIYDEPEIKDLKDFKKPKPIEFITLTATDIRSLSRIETAADGAAWNVKLEIRANTITPTFNTDLFTVTCDTYEGENNSLKVPKCKDLADAIAEKTSSFDINKYLYDGEQKMIQSGELITEEHVTAIRNEATGIKKSIGQLISALKMSGSFEKEQQKVPTENVTAKDKAESTSGSVYIPKTSQSKQKS